MLGTPVRFEDITNLGLDLQPEAQANELGQEEFLELMITQLRNQDPFKPLESGEFLGQLAQFGTVQGLAELNTEFASLAESLVSNQALQASNLVGRDVLIQSSLGVLGEEGIGGAVEVPDSTSAVQIEVTDTAGAVIQTIQLGPQAPGLARFNWNGLTTTGPAAEGIYNFRAQFFNGREMQDVPVYTQANVSSVTFGTQGLSLSLRGLGEVPFTAVKEIS